MTVRIGNAWCDERGKASGGKAGDNNGKELRTQDYYVPSTSWKCVFRANDPKVAEKLAKTMEDACANDNIGYDQLQRTTLYSNALVKKWDLSKIKTPCECDCSSLVAVCINACGIPISKDMYTGNEKSLIKATGEFITLTDTKYTNSSNYLKRGDILLKDGHTAIVLDDGAKIVENRYFTKYYGKSSSIVDILIVLGVDSSFANRTKIARKNGIGIYIGSAKQNLKLVDLAKKGSLLKP